MHFELPKRPEESNKATFGKVLNIAGSKYMPGAAFLSSLSAYAVGCGYVILACEDEVRHAISAQTQNVVFAPFSDIEKLLNEADVLEIGCGLSTSTEAVKIFKTAISNSKIPTIIDADGLNILAKEKIQLRSNCILTPHPKEASRLLEIELDEILSNFENSAKTISEKYNCVTVLKSHKTIICDNKGQIYYNKTGNNALAKAGSGDVLTGIISGLLAQGMDCFEAACLGCHVHGLCADIAAKDLTEHSVGAVDLIKYIPEAIKNIKNS